MVQLISVWYNLSQYGTTCLSMVQLVSVWYNLSQYGTTCLSMVQLVSVWYNLSQYGTTCIVYYAALTAKLVTKSIQTQLVSILKKVFVFYACIFNIIFCVKVTSSLVFKLVGTVG